MTCSDFLRSFSDYVDGLGTSSFREDADRHLDDCPACRRYLEVFERGTSLLRSFPEVEVSDDFRPRLQHRIYHVDDARSLFGGPSGSATTAVTVLGMAVLLVLAAWSPVLVTRDMIVEMSPIVVTEPEPRPMGLRSVRSGGLLDETVRFSGRADLSQGANALLFQYSPLAARLNRPRVQRAGLD